MVTASELRDRAAQELGLLQPGQSLAANHAARVTQGYAEVFEKLKKDGFAAWAYSGDVPNEFVQELAFMIAENCLGTYGVSEARYNRIKIGAQEAKRDIQKFATEDYVSQEEPEDY